MSKYDIESLMRRFAVAQEMLKKSDLHELARYDDQLVKDAITLMASFAVLAGDSIATKIILKRLVNIEEFDLDKFYKEMYIQEGFFEDFFKLNKRIHTELKAQNFDERAGESWQFGMMIQVMVDDVYGRESHGFIT